MNETAALVLAVFPDLTLALREGEMALAQSFFLSIKNWCVLVLGGGGHVDVDGRAGAPLFTY